MRRTLFPPVTVLAGALMLGCDNASPESDSTADVLDAPADFSALAGAQPFHFRTKGAFAEVSFSSGEGELVVSGSLSVSRGGTPGENPQTFLGYDVFQCDFSTGECLNIESGGGLIPNGDLIVRGRQVTLRTNTSAEANPAFGLFAGVGGRINLQWTRTQAVVTAEQGHFLSRVTGLYRFRSHFDRTFRSALVQGTIFGNAYPSTNGTIGTERVGAIEIIKDSIN